MLTPNRTSTRHETERRIEDRRQDDSEFNSPPWIEHMKINYVSWPRFDRREASRRLCERRQSGAGSADSPDVAKNHKVDYSSDLLTKEEKLFFEHLFKDKKS